MYLPPNELAFCAPEGAHFRAVLRSLLASRPARRRDRARPTLDPSLDSSSLQQMLPVPRKRIASQRRQRQIKNCVVHSAYRPRPDVQLRWLEEKSEQGDALPTCTSRREKQNRYARSPATAAFFVPRQPLTLSSCLCRVLDCVEGIVFCVEEQRPLHPPWIVLQNGRRIVGNRNNCVRYQQRPRRPGDKPDGIPGPEKTLSSSSSSSFILTCGRTQPPQIPRQRLSIEGDRGRRDPVLHLPPKAPEIEPVVEEKERRREIIQNALDTKRFDERSVPPQA
eukprot:scaffold1627_cov238-Pinguiococcus_pyrenoidosus.AAC.4